MNPVIDPINQLNQTTLTSSVSIDRPITSYTKPKGGIFIQNCSKYITSKLYPLDQDPSTWLSCHDAYEFTWTTDPLHLLQGLTLQQRLKLAKSNSFCPHHRCQLGNLSNNVIPNQCPEGLCYTKLENGGLSFGACCFINNEFRSGQIIGYANKSQHVAKPIYQHNRIRLHPQAMIHGDNSYEAFVNANQIHPSIIATQCPMFATQQDINQMILTQNISLWIEISTPHQFQTKDCIPITSLLSSSTWLLSSLPSKPLFAFENPEFMEYLSYEQNISDEITNDNLNNSAQILPIKGKRTFELFRIKDWEDFSIPKPQYHQDLSQIIQYINKHLQTNQTIAINCYSGRGRTGTFASMILGYHHKIKNHEQLIELIVQLRESRDGLVETPLQYQFIALFLGLINPSIPSIHHHVLGSDPSKGLLRLEEYSSGSGMLLGFLLGIFVVYCYFLVMNSKKINLSNNNNKLN